MLYKYVAQSPTDKLMSEDDFHPDSESETSGFHARSVANSMASNMTGKVDEQFESLQELLSGLTSGPMSKLVKNLKELSSLTDDDSLTPRDLKRALAPFATSIQTVQSSVAAIEKDLSALRVSYDEISDALVSFEGYLIGHAVFFKKIELRLSGVSPDEAEEQGDEFTDEVRDRNDTIQASVAAYAEGLNATCLEVQDAIAQRLELTPLSSDYVPDPEALPFTMENVAAFSSGTVARSERSGGSSAGGGYKYRDDFNALRGEAHGEISAMLEILAATIDFPHGKNLGGLRKKLADTIQAQETKFDQFLELMGSATPVGEDEAVMRHEALANVGRDLDEEVRLYRSLRTDIEALKLPSGSDASSADKFKPIVSALSSFLMSPKDGEVTCDLARMTQRVDALLVLFNLGRPELPLRLSDLYDHLVLDKGLKDCRGERLEKKTLNKVHALLTTLNHVEDLTHYKMIDSIRVQFEAGFSGAATGGGTATPSGKRK